jgi:hypothetical protein
VDWTCSRTRKCEVERQRLGVPMSLIDIFNLGAAREEMLATLTSQGIFGAHREWITNRWLRERDRQLRVVHHKYRSVGMRLHQCPYCTHFYHI